MSEIRVKDGESLESALRRFKRSTARSGVLAEVRKREAYEKPSVRRKKKSEAARKRKFKYFEFAQSGTVKVGNAFSEAVKRAWFARPASIISTG